MSVSSGTPFNARVKMGAGFVGGGPSPILNPRKMSFSGYSGSPLKSADSMFSTYMGLTHGEDFDFEGSTFEEEEGEDLMYDDDLMLQEVYYLVREVSDKIKSLSELEVVGPAVNDLTKVIDDDDEDLGQNPSDVDEASTTAAVGGYTGPLSGSKKSLNRMRKLMQKMYGAS